MKRHEEKQCDWAGCGNPADAVLSNRPLCRHHFYEIASVRLSDFGEKVKIILASENDRKDHSLAFLSELITQTTSLVSSAKFLSEAQRDQFLELSLSATEIYKRIQRQPRKKATIPVTLFRSSDPTRVCESTKTLNISKHGACLETTVSWETGESLWLHYTDLHRKALVQIKWITKPAAAIGVMGVEILDWEDFWEIERPLPQGAPGQLAKC